MNPNFIFVMSVEDMPYKAQLDVESQWREGFGTLLRDVGLDRDASYKIHASSRHIVIAGVLPEYAESQECVGPPAGMSQEVIDNFAKRRKLENYAIRLTAKGERWCGDLPRRHAAEVLPDVLNKLVDATSFDYVMQSHSWIRPVSGFVCMYEGKSVDFELQRIGVTTQQSLIGFPHRERIEFDGDLDPVKVLTEHGLLTDFAAKLEQFKNQLSLDEIDPNYIDLLHENLRTVPDPIAIKCTIPSEFMHFARELLVMPMTVHQKLVPSVEKAEFVAIANNCVSIDLVRRNTERVMRSRLQDVQDFYNKDTQNSLEFHLGRLQERVVFSGLGTYADRRARICKVIEEIAGDEKTLVSAARLLYFDLFTAMVEEFPEIEGTIARIYLAEAYNKAIANSAQVGKILENALWPRREDDALPGDFDRNAALLSWIKRLDTLVGFTILGKLPSGSKDPMCLRREAMGLVRIGFEVQPDVCWKQLAFQIVELYDRNLSAKEIVAKLDLFINQRVLYVLRADPQCAETAQDVLRGEVSVWSARDRCAAGCAYHEFIMSVQNRLRNLGVSLVPYAQKFDGAIECNVVKSVDDELSVVETLNNIMQKIAVYYQRDLWSEKLLVLRDACVLTNQLLDSVHIQTSKYREEIMRALGVMLQASREYAVSEK